MLQMFLNSMKIYPSLVVLKGEKLFMRFENNIVNKFWEKLFLALLTVKQSNQKIMLTLVSERILEEEELPFKVILQEGILLEMRLSITIEE